MHMDSSWAEIPWNGREAHYADATDITGEVFHPEILGLHLLPGAWIRHGADVVEEGFW